MQCNIREVLFDICQYQAKYFSSPIHYYKNSIVQIFLLLIFLDLNAKFTTHKHRRSIFCLGFDKNPMKSFRRNRFFYSNTGHIYWLTHICTINLNKKGELCFDTRHLDVINTTWYPTICWNQTCFCLVLCK